MTKNELIAAIKDMPDVPIILDTPSTQDEADHVSFVPESDEDHPHILISVDFGTEAKS